MYSYFHYDRSFIILDDDGGPSSSVFELKVLVAVLQQFGDALILVLLSIEVGLRVVSNLVGVAAVVLSGVIGLGVIFLVVFKSLACSVVDC